MSDTETNARIKARVLSRVRFFQCRAEEFEERELLEPWCVAGVRSDGIRGTHDFVYGHRPV